MTTGWSLREDSITLSPQEYTHASGIYKKMYFFLQMTMLHSCLNRGHGTLFIYTQGNQHMQCTFAPQVIGWYMSIYNQLFILVVELELKFRELNEAN